MNNKEEGREKLEEGEKLTEKVQDKADKETKLPKMKGEDNGEEKAAEVDDKNGEEMVGTVIQKDERAVEGIEAPVAEKERIETTVGQDSKAGDQEKEVAGKEEDRTDNESKTKPPTVNRSNKVEKEEEVVDETALKEKDKASEEKTAGTEQNVSTTENRTSSDGAGDDEYAKSSRF